MTKAYRGTVDPNDKKHVDSVELTVKILDSIDFADVIYGERSQSGAMGNAGGVIIDVLKDGKMTRYETNSREHPKIATAALLRIAENEDYFDTYAVGMGNGVFIKKGIMLVPHEIKGEKARHGSYFTSKIDDAEYNIVCSVYGVFRGLRTKLELQSKDNVSNSKPKNSITDVFQKGWEASWRALAKSKNMNTRRILYIEDDKAIAEVFKTRFEDKGYIVEVCDNGEDGLNATLDFKPDMIITGILMPKVSGYDVIDILKRTPETKDIPIVVLSALSRQEDIDRAMKLGAIDYMVMSEVRVKDVLKRIDELFAKSEHRS